MILVVLTAPAGTSRAALTAIHAADTRCPHSAGRRALPVTLPAAAALRVRQILDVTVSAHQAIPPADSPWATLTAGCEVDTGCRANQGRRIRTGGGKAGGKREQERKIASEREQEKERGRESERERERGRGRERERERGERERERERLSARGRKRK